MKVQYHGGKKYTITYGDLSYTIVADGRDHPMDFGLTEGIALEGMNACDEQQPLHPGA